MVLYRSGLLLGLAFQNEIGCAIYTAVTGTYACFVSLASGPFFAYGAYTDAAFDAFT